MSCTVLLPWGLFWHLLGSIYQLVPFLVRQVGSTRTKLLVGLALERQPQPPLAAAKGLMLPSCPIGTDQLTSEHLLCPSGASMVPWPGLSMAPTPKHQSGTAEPAKPSISDTEGQR